MGRTFDAIDAALADWIRAQHVFFVATAPLAADGLVNCSPKGQDTLRVLGPREVAYLDLTGSGVETIAHLRENGRVVLMLCAFAGPPRIVRLHGQGTVVEQGDDGFAALAAQFPALDGVRSVIRVAVARVSDSCGYAVPRMDFVEDRRVLLDWADRKGADGVRAYQQERNARSLDGLPGVRAR